MRILNYFLLFLFLFSLSSSNARSVLPPLQFTSLTINDGLPDNTVKSIFDDRDGFLWYGTKNGLARYDGTHLSVFKNIPNDSLSLPDDFVYCICQLHDGRIAVGGANGSLSFLAPQFLFDRNVSSQLSSYKVKSAVTDIIQSPDSRLWIATQSDGLFVFNPNDTSLAPFLLPGFPGCPAVLHLSDLCILGDELYIASNASSLIKINLKTSKVGVVELTSETISVQSFGSKMFPVGDTLLWISTERNGIYYFSTSQTQASRYLSSMTAAVSNVMTDIVVVHDSVLIVSYDGGGLSAQVVFSDTYQRIVPNEFVANSLPTGNIWDLHLTSSGDLCVGTYVHGACIAGLTQSAVSCVSRNTIGGSLMTNNSVLSVANLSSDYVLLATDGGGLFRYDIQNHLILPNLSKYQNPSVVKTIFPTSDSYICGTYGEGLVQWERKQSKIIEMLQYRLRGKSVWSIAQDSAGNVWCGTLYDGIYRTHGDQIIHHSAYVSPDSLPVDMVNALLCDSLGTMWVGTEGAGLRLFNKSTFSVPYNWSDYKTVVYSICLLPDSCVAVSYKNFGFDVFKYLDGEYKLLHESLLGNISVKSLLYSDKWGLFCATEKDVLLLDSSFSPIKKWSSVDGILSEGFNNASISINGDFLFVGSINGLNVISLSEGGTDKKSASVTVASISFYRDQVYYTFAPDAWVFSGNDTLALKYSDVDIRFSVAKMGVHAANSRFVYRILGLIDEWTPIPSDFVVSLPFVKGGEFTFELATENNMQYDNSSFIHLSVQRPYWQEIWFISSCIFGLIFILFSVYMYRDFSHKKLETLLQHKVDERTLYIMQQNRRLEDNSKLLVAKNGLLHDQKLALENQKTLLDESNVKINVRNDILEQQQEELERVNMELVLQQKEIELQATILQDKNKLLTKSLNYAKRIQDSLFPADSFLKAHLPESFVFFHPKEIVSGDFFWMKEVDGKIIVAEVDCTGHGVPGAFMSMIGNAFLNEIVLNRGVLDPAEIFYCLNEELMRIFGLGDFDAEAQDDGMDLSLLVIDFEKKTLKMASAMQNVYVIYPDDIVVYPGDIFSIGGLMARFKSPVYTVHELPIVQGMKVVLASDGYVDQFGGLHKEKYGTERFVQMLSRLRSLSCEDIASEIDVDFKSWLQDRSQLDDVLVVGIEL